MKRTDLTAGTDYACDPSQRHRGAGPGYRVRVIETRPWQATGPGSGPTTTVLLDGTTIRMYGIPQAAGDGVLVEVYPDKIPGVRDVVDLESLRGPWVEPSPAVPVAAADRS